MTRKHYYEMIAAAIKQHVNLNAGTYGGRDIVDTLAELAGELTDDFKRDNPRFDRARFLTACGLS